MRAALEKMGPYRVEFTVETDSPQVGSYQINGLNYHLQVADSEAFGSAEAHSNTSTRYEISHTNREVVVDRLDGTSRNLLDNPAHAFDFAQTDYAVAELSRTPARVVLRLTPKATAEKGRVIDLALDPARHLPVGVTYHIDTDRVRIRIRSIGPLKTPLPVLDRSKLKDYEWIDFR